MIVICVGVINDSYRHNTQNRRMIIAIDDGDFTFENISANDFENEFPKLSNNLTDATVTRV